MPVEQADALLRVAAVAELATLPPGVAMFALPGGQIFLVMVAGMLH